MPAKFDHAETLRKVVSVINDFEARKQSPINITNWRVQLVSNAKVTQKVTVSATVGSQSESVEMENFQPGRNLSKGAWVDVTGDKSGAAILDDYALGNIPNAFKETLALIGYWLTQNILGKQISAVSGGRSVLLATILENVNFSKLEVTVDGLTVGGNKHESYSRTFSLNEISNQAKGGRWRGDDVLALDIGTKRANSDGNLASNPIPEEW